jgi:hypothetical protein
MTVHEAFSVNKQLPFFLLLPPSSFEIDISGLLKASSLCGPLFTLLSSFSSEEIQV